MNVKPNIETAAPAGEGRSHHLRPDAMPWQDTRFTLDRAASRLLATVH